MKPSQDKAAFSRRFRCSGDFAAMHEAEEFLRDHGFSVGPAQGNDNRGIMFGPYAIAKWHNLNAQDQRAPHGVMAGNMQDGPVTVMIFADAPAEALQAIKQTPATATESK